MHLSAADSGIGTTGIVANAAFAWRSANACRAWRDDSADPVTSSGDVEMEAPNAFSEPLSSTNAASKTFNDMT
jgi:hypothetical protein